MCGHSVWEGAEAGGKRRGCREQRMRGVWSGGSVAVAGLPCRAWPVGLHPGSSREPRSVLGRTRKWSDSGFRKMSLDAERRLGGGTDPGG